jgi:hypothetical protein
MVRPKGKNRLHLEAEAMNRWTGTVLICPYSRAGVMFFDRSSSMVEGTTWHGTTHATRS